MGCVLALGALLRVEALLAPRWLDDHAHLAMLEGRWVVPRSPLDLFSFVRRDPLEHAALRDAGVLPWWSSGGLYLSFFRPVSSALLWLDHALFGRGVLGPHLHSLGWWALLVLAAAALLRELLPPGAALVALALFALDESATMPIGWLAGRNALVALAFAVLGLGSWRRWVTARQPRDGWRAALWWVLALLAGEYAWTALGYALVLAWDAPSARGRERLRVWAPLALPALAHLALWVLRGSGTLAVGGYLDPVHAPAGFLREAPSRLWGLGLELLVPGRGLWLGPKGVAGVVVCTALWVLHRQRTLEGSSRRVLWGALLGALLALLPVLGGLYSQRLLLGAELGFACALGLVVAEGWARGGAAGKAVALALVALHGGVAGAWSVGYGHLMHAWGRDQSRFTPPAAPWEERLVVALCVSDLELTYYTAQVWSAAHGGRVEAWRVLSHPAGSALLVRVSEDAIELRAKDAPLLDLAGISNVRRPEDAFQVGSLVDLRGMQVRVLELDHGAPSRVLFTFDRPVTDPSVLFVRSTPAGFVPVHLPAVHGALEFGRGY